MTIWSIVGLPMVISLLAHLSFSSTSNWTTCGLCTITSTVDAKAKDENGGIKVSHTPVAQLASFCLLALKSQALDGDALDKLVVEAKDKLKPWPEPYDETEIQMWNLHNRSKYRRKQISCRPEAKRRRTADIRRPTATRRRPEAKRRRTEAKAKPPLKSDWLRCGRILGQHARALTRFETAMKTTTLATTTNTGPHRQYRARVAQGSGRGGHRTMAKIYPTPMPGLPCVLGNAVPRPACSVSREGEISMRIAQMWSHIVQTTPAPDIQLIAAEFASLVGEQLRRNPYRHCIAVDPTGQGGKIGAMGALLVLELPSTATSSWPRGRRPNIWAVCNMKAPSICNWSISRARWCRCTLDLSTLHHEAISSPAGARVFHMMLMSYGGEVLSKVDKKELPDYKTAWDRSLEDVKRAGVDQGDERLANAVWNRERGRVMIIDFDRATLLPSRQAQANIGTDGWREEEEKEGGRQC